MDKQTRTRFAIVQSELNHALSVARDAQTRSRRAVIDLEGAVERVNLWLAHEDEHQHQHAWRGSDDRATMRCECGDVRPFEMAELV